MLKLYSTRPLIALLIISLICSACGKKPTSNPAPAQSVTLTVLAAASLTEAFNDLGQQFGKLHPGVDVVYNFAGSHQLAQQLGNGAPADIFASADQRQMDVAIIDKRIDNAAVHLFAQNRLVVIYRPDSPRKLHNLHELAQPGLKLVLASKEVPVGTYSLDFLANAAKDTSFGASFPSAVLSNVVSYENNVKAVLTKVSLGEADAGIVYTSDVTGNAAQTVAQLSIPDPLNVIAQYPIALVKDGHHLQLSQEFITFVLSPAGQQTLARYGFIPIGADR